VSLIGLPKFATTILGNRVKRKDLDRVSKIVSPDTSELESTLDEPNLIDGAKLIQQHIEKKSLIILYTDSDGDGISCATIGDNYSSLYLQNPFTVIVNKREYGNGINDTMLMKIIELTSSAESSLVITADHGSNNSDAITIMRDNGIDLLITDHHQVKDEPNPNVHINPQSVTSSLPKYISGAFVLYLLLLKHYRMFHNSNALLLTTMYEIVGLSTVSDMMDMSRNINRHAVNFAIEHLPNNTYIKEHMRKNEVNKLTLQTLSFGIIPSINSSNRLGEPDEGHKALVGKTQVESNRVLSKLNTKRKKMQRDAMNSALEHVIEEKYFVIAIASPGTEGVIGIIANSIGSIYNKVCVVFSDKEEPGDDVALKGSGRAGAINVDLAGISPMVTRTSDNYSKPSAIYLAGHAGAAGASVTRGNLERFVKEASDAIYAQVGDTGLVFHDTADFINPSREDINKIYANQPLLEPYGIGFTKPMVTLTNSTVVNYNYYERSRTLMASIIIDETGVELEVVAFYPAINLVDEFRQGKVKDIKVTLSDSFHTNEVCGTIMNKSRK